MGSTRNITAANAVFILSVDIVFPGGVQLQGFSADDIFGTDDMTIAETRLGVDSILSAGYIPATTMQKIMIMADSDSGFVFDEWYAQQKANQTVFRAGGTVILSAIGKKYTLSNGVLKQYRAVPDAKKVLEARTFGIEWESFSQAAA